LDDTLNTLSDDNLQFLLGRDIRHFYELLDEVRTRFPKTPAARAALDIAMHDAFTKLLGIPLGAFLGQKISTMATSVTIGIKSVADTIEEAQEYYDMGFRVIKVKTGSDLDEDIERMAKLREQFGNEFVIRVDANQGYDEAALKRFYNDTLSMDIELIEQPVKASAIALLKNLPEEIKALIAADESLLTPEDAFILAAPPAASGIFNIKLMKSGGVYPGRLIAHIANAAGISLMWGCNDESAISITAALHAGLSFPNTKYLDLDGSLDLVVDVVREGFKINNGYMTITDRPGLGVELLEGSH
jgi:L-alanine-DL-glutamate epimerase-like enolase superfamily enzyme